MNNKGFSHTYTCICSLPAKQNVAFLVAVLKAINLKQGFPGDSVVKNLPANAGDAGNMGLIPGSGNPLEKEMATDSSILA